MKKIISFLMCAGILVMLLSSCNREMYKVSSRDFDTVNVGTTANDGTGESLRSAFMNKLNPLIQFFNYAEHDLLKISTTDTVRIVSDDMVIYGLEGNDSSLFYTPVSMRDDAATLFPTIQSAAGDTSNYTVPDKIGDLYIDTSTGDAYYSSTSARNGWRSMGDRTTINTGTVVDGTGITTAMFSRFIYYSEAAATNITADPQIANGSAGQLITIIGSSDTNTLTLDDGAGLRLTGQMVLGIGDNITLLYENTIGDWIEISRSNN